MVIWNSWWHFAYIIQLILVKLIYFISLLNSNLGRKFNARRAFEQRNSDSSITSFDVGFHVSSEGELSQIYSLLEYFLDKKLSVLLLFTSPSVESKIGKLREVYPDLVTRSVVFTKVDYKFLSNLRMKNFSLCRYDFLPWLMLLGLKTEQFFLINATSIKWRGSSFFVKKLKNLFYLQFDLITTSSAVDEDIFSKLLPDKRILNIDLRSLEVKKRQAIFTQSDFYKMNEEFLLRIKKEENTFCFGSAWGKDLKVMMNGHVTELFKKADSFIFVFPHDLDEKNIVSIKRDLFSFGYELNIISRVDEFRMSKPGVINLVLIKGVLCELYPFFKFVIVGGGFGASVHSVLEPMLGGCITFCGPIVHRSTEVENFVSKFPSRMFVCSDTESLAHQLTKCTDGKKNKFTVNDGFDQITSRFSSLVGFYES